MNRSTFFLKPLMLLLFFLQWLSPQAQTCENFNNNSVGAWQVSAAVQSVSTVAPLPPDNSPYLRVRDWFSSQTSILYNTSYNSALITCGVICFDYKIFNDGVANSVEPISNTIRITAVVNNQTLTATFQLFTPINENSAWLSMCVPLSRVGPGAALPSNGLGIWVMNNGTNSDWNTLVSNFTRVQFLTDVAGSSSQDEYIGIDNFCVRPTSCCEIFDTPNSFGNWQVTNGNRFISSAPPTQNNTSYLRITDGGGNSSLLNTSYNATTIGCGTICFDYKIFDDAIVNASTPIFNTIRISAVVNGVTLAAVFNLNNAITESSGWLNICVPLSLGAAPPGNAQGTWVMLQGNNAQWNTLVRNYSQVSFFVDVAGSTFTTEVIGLDNFCAVPGYCCDPNPTPAFTIQRTCNNGIMEVMATANDTYSGTSHWWGLMETSVCGNTDDANTVDGNPATPGTIDPVAPVLEGTTATFNISDYSKCYYIKHGIWQDSCFTWMETRIPVEPINAINIFFLEDANGVNKTQFCYGEDIYLDGTASQGENSYYIDVWRRPAGNSGAFSYYKQIGWATGQVGVVNLTQLLNGLNPPAYFEPGYEYQVKLALQNLPNCIGWTERVKNFTVVCCENYLDGCFKADVQWNGNNTYNLKPVFFNTYANIGATHEWYVLSSPNLNTGPYTPVASLSTTTQTGFTVYNAAQPGLYYYVIHKIKTACGEICTQVIQYQQTLAREKDSELPGINVCTNIDCCTLNDYWPNGPGQTQPFTAEFNVTTATNGGQYSISATPLYSYNNNPGIAHQWYLFSSPNPNGGPYTLVHQSTGAAYTYPTANNGLYYFVIHRVKSACGEKCYGRSVYQNAVMGEAGCDLCGEIDCSIIDRLIDPCATPVNLVSDCDKQALRWDAVTGATGYVVEISYNDPNCCRTNLFPSSAQYAVTSNYLELKSILSPAFDCLRWRVLTRCANETSLWSDWICYDCKRQVTGKQLISKNEEQKKPVIDPVVAPNPNNGTMSLYMSVPGDLKVTVEVYNTFGKMVHSMKQRSVPGGQFSETLTLPLAYKGMYTVVFKTNYGTFNKKIVVN